MSKIRQLNAAINVMMILLKYAVIGGISLCFIATIYFAVFYPDTIIKKTKFGMTKQQIESVYADKDYGYYDQLIGCSVGCTRNILVDKSTNSVPVLDTEVIDFEIVEYMVVPTGIDGVFIIGLNKDGIVVFATAGET